MITLRRPGTTHLLDIAGRIFHAVSFHTVTGVKKLSGIKKHRRFNRRPAPGDDPQPLRAVRSVEHVGATERFGAELRALRHIEVSPELVSDIETELRWGLIWYEFERSMQTEIDRVFAEILPVADCLDFDDLREMIGLRELEPA